MPKSRISSTTNSPGLTLTEATALDIPTDAWEAWEPCGDGKRRPTARWLARATNAILNRRKGPLSVSQLRRLTRKLSR